MPVVMFGIVFYTARSLIAPCWIDWYHLIFFWYMFRVCYWIGYFRTFPLWLPKKMARLANCLGWIFSSSASDDKPTTESPFPSGISSAYLLSFTCLPSYSGWIYITGCMACYLAADFQQSTFFSVYCHSKRPQAHPTGLPRRTLPSRLRSPCHTSFLTELV